MKIVEYCPDVTAMGFTQQVEAGKIEFMSFPHIDGRAERASNYLWWMTICAVAVLLSACTSKPTAIATPTSAPVPTFTPTSTATPQPTATSQSPNKLGIHLLLDDGRNAWPTSVWPQHLHYARELVGEWGYVTELVRLDDLDPPRWQVFFDACAELHLKPILRLATTYDRAKGLWLAPSPDPQGSYQTTAEQYARFVAAVHWPSAPHYIIVGNEPNHGDEWGGQANPVAYARFLIDTSAALHQVDPEVKVLNAPLDPFTPNTNGQPFINGMTYLDGESFLDQMHAGYPDVFASIDIWASHSYAPGPLAEGPWRQTFQIDLVNGANNPKHIEPPAGIFNRGVNGYEWELFKLATYGVHDLPVMITETGWRHRETTDPNAADNGRTWPAVLTVTQYIDLALNGNHGRYPQWPDTGWIPWQDDPRVIAVTPFALDGAPKEWGHTNWLQLDSEGNVLGTYPMFELLRSTSAAYR